MKRWWIWVVILLALVPAIRAEEQKGRPLPGVQGFRGLEWGSSVRDVPERMVLAIEGQDTRTYVRVGDSMRIGGATLSTLGYEYYKDQLMVVNALADGARDANELHSAVFGIYGDTDPAPFRAAGQDGLLWIWTDPERLPGLSVRFWANRTADKAMMILIHLPTREQQTRDREAASREAHRDF